MLLLRGPEDEIPRPVEEKGTVKRGQQCEQNQEPDQQTPQPPPFGALRRSVVGLGGFVRQNPFIRTKEGACASRIFQRGRTFFRKKDLPFCPVEYILYSLNIIKPKRIRDFGRTHAVARVSLEGWLMAAKRARWKSLTDVRGIFRSVDVVTVASGRNVLVFNIAGNRFRLIVAAHFNKNTLFVLRFLTHAEYSKDQWKKEL